MSERPDFQPAESSTHTPGSAGATHRAPAVRFIFVTAVLDVLGFGLLIPVAPKLVQTLQGGTEAEAAPAVAGLSVAFSIMLFLCAPVLGALSDVVGRRPVILFSMLGSGLDYFVSAFAPSVRWLYFTRAVNGMTGASLSAANAYIADVTPPEKRAGAFGMMGAAFGLGFTIGPLIGGFLGSHDVRWPFIAAGALTLVNWLYGLFVLPESLPRERRRTFSWKRANPFAVFGHLGKYRLVLGLSIAVGILMVAQVCLHVTWVLYTSYRYGWGPREVGLSLFVVGVSGALVQGKLAGKIIPALGERRSLVCAVGLAVVAYVGYGSMPQGWMVYPIIVVGSFAGLAQPAAQSLITRTVRADEQGETQGAITGIQSIAGIAAPFIGGGVFAFFVSKEAPVLLPGAPFYVSAGLSLVALLLIVVVFARNRPAPPTAAATAGANG